MTFGVTSPPNVRDLTSLLEERHAARLFDIVAPLYVYHFVDCTYSPQATRARYRLLSILRHKGPLEPIVALWLDENDRLPVVDDLDDFAAVTYEAALYRLTKIWAARKGFEHVAQEADYYGALRFEVCKTPQCGPGSGFYCFTGDACGRYQAFSCFYALKEHAIWRQNMKVEV